MYGFFCYQFVGGLAGIFCGEDLVRMGVCTSVSFVFFVRSFVPGLCPAPFNPFNPFDLFCPIPGSAKRWKDSFFGGPGLL